MTATTLARRVVYGPGKPAGDSHLMREGFAPASPARTCDPRDMLIPQDREAVGGVVRPSRTIYRRSGTSRPPRPAGDPRDRRSDSSEWSYVPGCARVDSDRRGAGRLRCRGSGTQPGRIGRADHRVSIRRVRTRPRRPRLRIGVRRAQLAARCRITILQRGRASA